MTAQLVKPVAKPDPADSNWLGVAPSFSSSKPAAAVARMLTITLNLAAREVSVFGYAISTVSHPTTSAMQNAPTLCISGPPTHQQMAALDLDHLARRVGLMRHAFDLLLPLGLIWRSRRVDS